MLMTKNNWSKGLGWAVLCWGATALERQRNFKAHALPDAPDVDVHDPVEQGFVAVGQLILLEFDAGVIEDAAQSAVVVLDHRQHGLDLIGIGHVALAEHGITVLHSGCWPLLSRR